MKLSSVTEGQWDRLNCTVLGGRIECSFYTPLNRRWIHIYRPTSRKHADIHTHRHTHTQTDTHKHTQTQIPVLKAFRRKFPHTKEREKLSTSVLSTTPNTPSTTGRPVDEALSDTSLEEARRSVVLRLRARPAIYISPVRVASARSLVQNDNTSSGGSAGCEYRIVTGLRHFLRNNEFRKFCNDWSNSTKI